MHSQAAICFRENRAEKRFPLWPGLTGVGEVRPVNKTDSFLATVEELAARYVVGADPFDTERLAWAIERLEYGRPSEHGQSALARGADPARELGGARPRPARHDRADRDR